MYLIYCYSGSQTGDWVLGQELLMGPSPHVICGSLGPHKSVPQTASQCHFLIIHIWKRDGTPALKFTHCAQNLCAIC